VLCLPAAAACSLLAVLLLLLQLLQLLLLLLLKLRERKHQCAVRASTARHQPSAGTTSTQAANSKQQEGSRQLRLVRPAKKAHW
jgi:hypothetical protein